MKVLPFKIPRNNSDMIMVQHDQESHIYHILHQHPELQLTLIRKSFGTAVIGGHIGEFEEGDVFIIGSNVPHVFRNDESFYENTDLIEADVIYVFLDELMPENTLLNHELVQNIFVAAKQGIKLKGELREKVGKGIERLLKVKGLERLIQVLSIIDLLADEDNMLLLNQEMIKQSIDENDGKRLNDVIQFTFENYAEKITLEQVAEIANMVPSAFCRFFKQRTRKTYFDFLNEIRIRHACRLLLNKDMTIVKICFLSGFNNLSYFNRKFKQMTGYSPLKYHNALKGVRDR
ncbi:AraC family transcriptional regulator [Fulvivirga sediminis]|uniref:Helix-turn-helix domain-containing protein n=1 Tax=Fulvivirga sediminis TaxID=2803949 RepID=A0A937F3Y4_9BACT|nr:AraC family transcriptional regulator [Fulvivirga sediminis]MBL3655907.1 helix-turn-helix domain-containing protein [Fulvivirga sediminis]